MSSRISDAAPRVAFTLALVVAGFTYGYLAHRRGWWPHAWVVAAGEGLHVLRSRVEGVREWYYFDTESTVRASVFNRERMAPGATLVAGLGPDNHQFIQIVDADAAILQEWRVDWFDLWPNADHLDEEFRPKALPGAIVHGVWLLDDGDVLLQHDACGLVRLDACGHVVWRLAARTHHSLDVDERGHIWTSIRHTRREPRPGYFAYRPPFEEYTIVEIDPAGQIVQEVSIFDLLRENDLTSLLYLATWHDNTIDTGGDTLHVNDVEVFPRHLAPGLFQPGDVMVSLRRPNAVVVFDLSRRAVRHVAIGGFIRQHDPDFIDGNTVSIFDNNHQGGRQDGLQSRIVVRDVRDGRQEVAFTGTAERPFFTDIMGKHQWLPNGNLLVVESTRGRVWELTPEGELVWQFENVLGDGLAGALAEGIRLDPKFTREFFAERRAQCGLPADTAVAAHGTP